MTLGKKSFIMLFLGAIMIVSLALPFAVSAGSYADSAHGNSGYGVDRNSIPVDYVTGNCIHCHEQHASVGGLEPSPVNGVPSPRTLFSPNSTWQNDNFCFECHDATANLAVSAIVNRSYSYRAGGWTSDPVDDIKEIFNSSGSAHNLDDISNFVNNRWGYTDANNPCAACHNPHAVQGDPPNAPNVAKSSAARGSPVARVSQHANLSTWGLWGDDIGEKMSDYSTHYQAPYRYNSTVRYEPDGSTSIDDGSNLTDVNTFCSDCHNSSNTIYSTTLGRNLKQIDWNSEKHGRGNADIYISVDTPYTVGSTQMGYVLACTDCHEPHGSPNVFLLRKEVNGAVLSADITSPTSTDLRYLCARCHDNNNEAIHHSSVDKAYTKRQCRQCHYAYPIRCSDCHFHGSWVNDPNNSNDHTPDYNPTIRRTF